MRRPRTIVERAQDAHGDGSETLNKASAESCWPRGNVNLEHRRDSAQVAASGTGVLATIQKGAIQAASRDWCRYTVAQTDDNSLQEQGRWGCWEQGTEGEEGGG